MRLVLAHGGRDEPSGEGPIDDEERRRAIEDETRRVRELRMIVDLTANLLAQSRMTRVEAETLVTATRRRILELFPDKEGTYDLILAPRFARLMAEFVGPESTTNLLTFRRPADR